MSGVKRFVLQEVVMCASIADEEENESECEEEIEDCPFLNIPVEVFLHICCFLDARFITHSLSKVCKRFHDILSDNSIWKSRIAKRISGDYPALPVNPDTFDWGSACAVIEDEYNIWHNRDKSMKRILLRDIHYASVDAVLLMKSGTLCFSGSRDHNLAAWDLTEAVLGDPTPKVVIPNAHKGWIWNLTSLHDKLYSCSWDATVKSWDIEEGLRELYTFPCKHPALTMACNPDIMAVGLFNRRVMLFDPRVKGSMSSYSIHTGAVLALTMMNNYIISASEDKTVGVWDFRNCKQVAKQPIYSEDSEINGYPMSLSYSNGILYVGDVKGQLHLIDPTSRKFDIVERIDVGHRDKITAIQHNSGCVMTCSTDGTLRISAPTRNLEPISIIKARGGEITKFDYKHSTLAMGTTDCLVEVWLPKAEYDD